MKRKRATIGAIIGVAILLLAGCGDDDPYTGDATGSDEYVSTGNAASDDEIGLMALGVVWDSKTPSEQDELCAGWVIAPDLMLDSFMESNNSISPTVARAFFDGKCN